MTDFLESNYKFKTRPRIITPHKYIIDIRNFPISKEKSYQFRHDTPLSVKKRFLKRIQKKGYNARFDRTGNIIYVPTEKGV